MEKNKKREKSIVFVFPGAAITKDHSLGRAESNGNPFSHCSGGCKSDQGARRVGILYGLSPWV